MLVESLNQANNLIKKFQDTFNKPALVKGKKLFTGVDLGTAYIVLAVVDEAGEPVAGAMQFAQVVKDGLVVDYMGAVDIVKNLKKRLEGALGYDLLEAGTAYPPGTIGGDQRAIGYVAEAAGFEVISMIDEPTAANNVLKIENGAVVDIGGGTTGIAVLKNKEVVYVADEPTGGTHFSLVIAGSHKISFLEAEELKRDFARHGELFPIVKPVVEKVAAIVQRHIKGHNVNTVYLVGGTSCFEGMEKVIEKELEIPVIKPDNPLLVTPLGIALEVQKT
ncbi:ethanolamine utilization protein EutJ [Desulfitibacter alkalitolerans]|uniref:ethanolamine utilization protein EutJ n=1 Tax=Desulfitibacter alkalitolerans TaxID=264641 RepID=UPI0009FED141